jgi:hypothetical protein
MVPVMGMLVVTMRSVVPQPNGITGIIKPRVKSPRRVIVVTVAVLVIISFGRRSFTGNAPVESVVPALFVYVVRFEAVGVFFKKKRSIACGQAPAVATLHKTHLVGRRLLSADHFIHLRHARGE